MKHVWNMYTHCGWRIIKKKRFSQLSTRPVDCYEKTWKKIQAWTGIEPIISVILVTCSTNWAIKPTGDWSCSEFILAVTYCYNPPINFRAIYFTSRCAKSQGSYHAITPVCVDICPSIISVEKKQSQREKAGSRVSPFHLYYFTWEKNKFVL